jgi:hypothetical protein
VCTNPQYVRLWTALTLSKLGDSCLFLTIPVLLYTTTHTAQTQALALTCEVLPYLCWGLLGGVWADTQHRKTILVWGDGAAAVLVLGLLLQLRGGLSLGLLYGFLFALASVTAVYEASFETSVAAVVAPAQIEQAYAGMKLSDTLTSSLGPALAGLVLAHLGPGLALGLDAVSFLCSGLLLARLQHRPTPLAAAPPALRARLRDGLRFLWHHPVLRAGVGFMVFVNIGQGVAVPLGLFYLQDTVHLQAAALGWLWTLSTGGSLLALAAFRSLPARPRGQLMVGAGCGLGLAYLLLSRCHTFGLALVCRLLTHAAVTTVHLAWTTLRQTVTPPDLRGRVGSATWVLTLLVLPCSAGLASVLVPLVGVAPLIGAAGVFLLGASLLMGWYSRLARPEGH